MAIPETDDSFGTKITNEADEFLGPLPAEVANAPLFLDPAQSVRTLALTMAVKYHGDTIIKDGGMYQQLRMEQKDIQPTHVNVVLKTAIEFERYLRGDYAEMVDQLVGGDFEKWLGEKVEEAAKAAGHSYEDHL